MSPVLAKEYSLLRLNWSRKNLHLSEGSFLSASSLGEGDAGSIILNLGDKLTMRDNSIIGTLTTKSDGSNIFITAQNYLYLIDSEISTSVVDSEAVAISSCNRIF